MSRTKELFLQIQEQMANDPNCNIIIATLHYNEQECDNS